MMKIWFKCFLLREVEYIIDNKDILFTSSRSTAFIKKKVR